MTPIRPGPSTALVLETNNLRGGGAGAARIVESLGRLLAHLGAQTRPLAALHELVITHDGLSAAARADLERVAGREIRFVEIAPETGYYEAKNAGFDATSAAVVAFGDADCWPEPAWLERLLAPFEDPGVEAVAGRTTYRGDVFGQAASAIDFMYFAPERDAGATRNFYANNVAFRREVFAARRYEPVDGMYRGHCQVLGMRLARDGVRLRFEPAARTVHRFPDGVRELARLRLFRGADTRRLVPFLAAAHLPARLRFLGRPVRLASMAVLAARLGYSARAIGRQDMPRLGLVRRATCVAVMAAISGVDAIGALFGRSGSEGNALSYHENADRLAAAAVAA